LSAVDTTETPAKTPQDIFTENVKTIFHAIANVMPFRFEREAEIFHAAIDKVDTALEDLFAPIATIGAPSAASDLQVEVDELKKLVTQLLAAQGVTTSVTAPAVVETPVVAEPVASPTPDPVPVPEPIVTPGS
jgi:hypothetical protein